MKSSVVWGLNNFVFVRYVEYCLVYSRVLVMLVFILWFLGKVMLYSGLFSIILGGGIGSLGFLSVDVFLEGVCC